MKVKTYLPIFSGFYQSQWEFDYNYIDNFINQEREEKGLFSKIDFNDIKIDNASYELDIVKSFCDVLPDLLPNYINGIELEKICYPKKYNFQNDSANVIIDINENKIKEYLINNLEAFKTFLKLRYTSYDGFISHYDNDLETWESEIKNFTDYTINGHYLGSILDFIANMEKIDNYTVYERIFENVDFLSYVENWDEIINQSDNSLFEFLTKNGFSNSWAEYIERSFQNNVIGQLCLDEKTLSIIKQYRESLIET